MSMMDVKLNQRVSDGWWEITSPNYPAFQLTGPDLPKLVAEYACAAIMMAHNGVEVHDWETLKENGFH